MLAKRELHMERFDQLMMEDNTDNNDIDRVALFFVIAGNNDLFQKRKHIYDFKAHCIKYCLDDGKIDFSSGSKALIRLAFNLYNNYQCSEISPHDIMKYLDSDNLSLAIEAIQLRFVSK